MGKSIGEREEEICERDAIGGGGGDRWMLIMEDRKREKIGEEQD